MSPRPGNGNPLESGDLGAFARRVGLELVRAERGTSRLRLEAGPRHWNPHGVLHGGVLFSLADTGMGAALYTLLSPGEWCASIEIKLHFLAPVRRGPLVCDTRVVNRGRRVALLESRLRQGRSTVGLALGTFSILGSRES
ncbi:MAG: PaaI family thioesterase [Euryarchaeota archaeon]|nr:PaaI family thioesterase [Euryarchaeota archaeon]